MNIVVIDANLWVSTVIPYDYSSYSVTCLRNWRQQLMRIIVPVLWHYEVVSSLRKAIALKMISMEDLDIAFLELTMMAFEEIKPSYELDRVALDWARRLDQTVAYDSQYLAVAEQYQAEFWTADRRLVNNVRQRGFVWVHWVGESHI